MGVSVIILSKPTKMADNHFNHLKFVLHMTLFINWGPDRIFEIMRDGSSLSILDFDESTYIKLVHNNF